MLFSPSLLANNQQDTNCFQLTFVKGKQQTSNYGSTSPKEVKVLPLTALFHEKKKCTLTSKMNF